MAAIGCERDLFHLYRDARMVNLVLIELSMPNLQETKCATLKGH